MELSTSLLCLFTCFAHSHFKKILESTPWLTLVHTMEKWGAWNTGSNYNRQSKSYRKVIYLMHPIRQTKGKQQLKRKAEKERRHSVPPGCWSCNMEVLQSELLVLRLQIQTQLYPWLSWVLCLQTVDCGTFQSPSLHEPIPQNKSFHVWGVCVNTSYQFCFFGEPWLTQPLR